MEEERFGFVSVLAEVASNDVVMEWIRIELEGDSTVRRTDRAWGEDDARDCFSSSSEVAFI